MAGLIADARALAETARTEASNYRADYNAPIPARHLADRLGMYLHAYTLYSFVRPFGCSVMMAACDEDGPELFMADPSGVHFVSHGWGMGEMSLRAEWRGVGMV